MENYRSGLRSYFPTSRRSYSRLDGGSVHSRRRRTGIEVKRRKFWRVKISPKLKLLSRIRFSPRRILTRIRDAYVRLMLGFANSAAGAGGSGFGGEAVNGFGRRPQLKEYDEKMIVQIYRSFLVQSQLGADGRGLAASATLVV